MGSRGDAEALKDQLRTIDGRGYKAYKDIRGDWSLDDVPAALRVDYVQGDPFASPSRMRLLLDPQAAGFPDWARSSKARRVALADFLARRFAKVAAELSSRRGSGKSGMIAIDAPGQQVLERSAMQIDEEGQLEARFVVGLPAKGRRVRGRQAAEMLCEDLPDIAVEALIFEEFHDEEIEQMREHLESVEDARWLREQLDEQDLVAFVADGSVLPRISGVDDRPMRGDQVVPFLSPPELRDSFTLPNRGRIEGMAIERGVTLIVGGGYHGKSTLLQAIALGIYDHIPGDGRELVVSSPQAIKIRAEDGRRVEGVDITPFINDLPGGRSTLRFDSEDASGSTSQAAGIVEALEAGADLLLMDEDSCATNFMIRDERMQRLIDSEDEPITPFIDRVQELHTILGVSTIVVIGGSGDYFDVADRVIAMKHYGAEEVTEAAHQIAREQQSGRQNEARRPLTAPAERIVVAESIDPSRGKRDVKINVRDRRGIRFGEEDLDLSGLEQLVDRSQLRAIAEAMVAGKRRHMDRETTLREALESIEEDMLRGGLDALSKFPMGDLAWFRPLDLACALNRLRSLKVLSTAEE